MSLSKSNFKNWKSIGLIALGAIGVLHILTKQSKNKTNGNKKKLIGVELGGTNAKIALIEFQSDNSEKISNPRVIEKFEIKTTTPEETLEKLYSFIKEYQFEGIGIATFGPLNLKKSDPGFGTITTTPKKGWPNARVFEFFAKKRDTKVSIDTDVGAAAAAEYILGNHGVHSLVYVTVGTGVGIGIVNEGKILHGLTHPEGGHINVKLVPEDKFGGVCSFHGNCLEGLTTNEAIGSRLNIDKDHIQTIDENHDVWKYVANYLAQLCLNLTLTISPEVIILGGGVMHQKNLLGWIKKDFVSLLNGYVKHPKIIDIDNYIKKPFLEDDVGLIGGALLTLIDK